MLATLGATALFMGIVGGPHCIAMCGAACAGIGQGAGPRSGRALLAFQVGRILGYAGVGALAAMSMQGLGWLTVQSSALRPVWSMLHAAAFLLGLVLLLRARQPVWLEQAGRRLWTAARAFGAAHGGAPLVLGMLWALLPCGLLYSALAVAALAGSALDGAWVMALFALGTSITLGLGPWLWLKLRRRPLGGDGSWGVRLAGLALAGTAAWGLWMGLVHNTAPWCISP